jgi:GNAT superfamily N-acetyltransferase
MNDCAIRALAPKDEPRTLAAMKRLHLLAFPTYEMINFGLSGTYWWVVEHQTQCVGFAALWPSVRTPFTGYLARAAVHPIYRGRGLQRRLIRVRERKAKALGWAAMVTDCLPTNLHSANNFIACGYRLYKPEVSWAAYENPLYWRKYLDRNAA